MSSEGGEPRHRADPESLRCQLSEVHDRAKLHAGRLWQLPFSYIGVVGLSLAIIEAESKTWLISWLFGLYTVFGVLVFLAMLGAFEGTKRALQHMIRIEQELGLVVTTKVRVVYQFLPHFSLAIATLTTCLVVLFRS